MICVMYCSKSLNTGSKLASEHRINSTSLFLWEKKDSETDFF